jgi:hypothetical protein
MKNRLSSIKMGNKKLNQTLEEFLTSKDGVKKEIITPEIEDLVSQGLMRLVKNRKPKKKYFFF